MITATSKRVEGYRQEVEVDGHTIAVDEPLDAGGTDTAPSPTTMSQSGARPKTRSDSCSEKEETQMALRRNSRTKESGGSR